MLTLLLAVVIVGSVGTAGAARPVSSSATLNQVQGHKVLECGVSGFAVGFSEFHEDGSVTGFDADMCRAVAAAVLGDANAVEFTPLTTAERFNALNRGTVDVLMRITTETLIRDTAVGVNFGPTYFYDGQSLLIDPAAVSGVTPLSTLADLEGITICVPTGTTLELNIVREATAAGISFTIEPVGSFFEAVDTFIAGDCDAITSDRTGLAGIRAFLIDVGVPGAESLVILNRLISKEPLAPVVKDGDDGWLSIVSWIVYATFLAEEVGITSANIDAMRDATPEISRTFGAEADSLAGALGLDAEWAYQVIKQVGNYGEIYGSHLEPIGLSRSGTLNDSYLDGGLIYAPPFG